MARTLARVGAVVARGARRISSRLLGRIEAGLRRRAPKLFDKLDVLRDIRRRYRARTRKAPAQPPVPEHADERTIRRVAEEQQGGVSSREGTERWLRGETPGGTHRGGGEHRGEGPLRPRPGDEEPQERAQRLPGGAKRVAVRRRGAA